MNISPAKRLEALTEYIFSHLNKKVSEVEKMTGRKVLSFGVGSPDIMPSKKYITELISSVQQPNAHKYPGYGATKEFSSSLITWYTKRFNVDIEDDELYPVAGEKDAIAHMPLAFLNPDDEVLVPNPGYPAFSIPAQLVKARVVSYDLLEKNNFKISLENLRQKISSKTKFIWINFPSNPTGQVITYEELEQLVSFAKEKNIFIVYDNVYSEITFDGYTAPSILEIPGAKEVAVELGSFSKSFSLAGYRLGWIAGNKTIIKHLAKIKSHYDSGIALPIQNLGAFALSHFDQQWHDEMITTYDERRKRIGKYLQQFGLTFSLPQGGLYIWAKIPNTAESSEEYCLKLLQEKQILFTPGIAFGKNGERYIRISICTDITNITDYFSV